ncbi:hypothetical protein Bbelb_017750 [Branchiostoma belcheri]|nr:hypothetical protein Bbelb_017750 [Branchiostoma belcheri]
MKVLAAFLLFLGVALACDFDEYDCGAGNGYCIPSTWECDGWDDCTDGVDESNCLGGGGGTGPADHNCILAHQQPCDNGGCVPLNWVCDGDDDCGDYSDEQNCAGGGPDPGPLTPTQCSSTQFECDNGHCIYSTWECDDYDDCGDNSDEQNCPGVDPGPTPCASNQFQCDNGQCTYSSWVCDGDNDCGDNSDEQNCPGVPDPDPVPTGCSSDRFECDNGRCILANWECDGYDDCGDNSDEEHCSGGGGIISPVVNPETPCGGQLKDDAGIVTHLNYDNSMDCEWKISVSPGNYVYMEFTQFELENPSSSTGTCRYDYLEIYDGLSDSAPLLAKLCGDERPKPVQSTGNRVKLVFKSDGSLTKDGFEMRYYAVDDGTNGSGEGSGSTVVDARDMDAFIF